MMGCFRWESTKRAILGSSKRGDRKVSVMNVACAMKNKSHYDIQRQRKRIAHTQFIINTLSHLKLLYSIIFNIPLSISWIASKYVSVIFISSLTQTALRVIHRKAFFILVWFSFWRQFFSAFIIFEIVRFFPHHKPGGHRFSKASNDELSSFSSSAAAFSSVMVLFFPHHRPGGQRFSKASTSACWSSSSDIIACSSGIPRFFLHHSPGGHRFSSVCTNSEEGAIESAVNISMETYGT